MSLWLLAVALAQEPAGAQVAEAPVVEAPPAEPAPPDDGAAIEVIVYEQLLVEQARQKVYDDLLQAGYTERVRKDDKTIFRHPDPWKAEVHVYDDGWMRVKRQKVQVEGREMPWAERNTPLAWAGCIIWSPLCIRPGGQTLGKKKHRNNEDRIVRWAQGDVEDWGERIADLAVKQKVDGLPQALEALWTDGIPLEGDGPPLATAHERRLALMTYWASRTDTVWGERVRDAVESFCRGVVQSSDTPFSPEEIRAFNEARPGQAEFSLERPPVAEGP